MSREPQPDMAAAILAGGLGSRMGHANKALLEVGGEPVAARLARILAPLFREVFLVARDPAPLAFLGLRIVPDLFAARSSLTGIHAALAQAGAPWVFVTACDTPLLKPELVRRLQGLAGADCDLVAPQQPNGHYEPLCALYSPACLPHMEDLLRRDISQIILFFPKVRVKAVPVDDLRREDPDLASFENANTPQELEHLRRMTGDAP